MNLHQWSVDQGDGVSGQRSMSHNANLTSGLWIKDMGSVVKDQCHTMPMK